MKKINLKTLKSLDQVLDSWELIQVRDREWREDKSGLYTTISYRNGDKIGLDLVFAKFGVPVITFEGDSDVAVYKGLADFLDLVKVKLSSEHLMYIGRELARCQLLKQDYVQD